MLPTFDQTAAAFPWIACSIALATAVTLPLVNRRSDRRRDLQLSLNVGRKLWALLAAWVIVVGTVTTLLGVVLTPRFPFLWGLFPLAAAHFFVLLYYLWVDRLPFPITDDEVRTATVEPPGSSTN